jgi:hypothetical protein
MTLPDITNINGELLGLVFSVICVLITWAWHKARGEKQRSLAVLIEQVIAVEIEDALTDGETLDAIEERLSRVLLKLAEAIGKKIPKYTAKLMVQAGVMKFRQALRARRAYLLVNQ